MNEWTVSEQWLVVTAAMLYAVYFNNCVRRVAEALRDETPMPVARILRAPYVT